MTDVIVSATSMEDMRLSPAKDHLTFQGHERPGMGLVSFFIRFLQVLQIFPDPSDFEHCCKLKDRLPSIVVEATEGEVESGELRWPPEEFLVSEEEDEEHKEKLTNAGLSELEGIELTVFQKHT